MNRVLSIAGFDPSGGAGVLADIKVFHQFQVQGSAVCTGVTYQNHREVLGMDWLSYEQVHRQLEALLKQEKYTAVKIGIIPSLVWLYDIVSCIKESNANTRIVWDPVIAASEGFNFLKDFRPNDLLKVLPLLTVMTPNLPELEVLESGGTKLSECTAVIVKGGHAESNESNDVLLEPNKQPYVISNPRLKETAVHGSGCAFSSAITACLANGLSIQAAFHQANEYVFQLLQTGISNESFHHKVLIND